MNDLFIKYIIGIDKNKYKPSCIMTNFGIQKKKEKILAMVVKKQITYKIMTGRLKNKTKQENRRQANCI